MRIMVHTGPEQLERTAFETFLGPLWFSFDGTAFPEEGWRDFVIVVLGWWISKVRTLAASDQGDVELSFMDGPVTLYLSKAQARESAQFHGVIGRGGRQRIVATGEVDVHDLLTELER